MRPTSVPLALHTVVGLAATCAPSVAPETLLSLATAESGLDPLAIGVNGPAPRALHPSTLPEAIQVARSLTNRGVSVDLGLTQINVRNLPALGLSLADAFDACANLRGGAQILAGGYARSRGRGLAPQPALRAALSLYNTGDPARGFANGYVARVVRAAASFMPSEFEEPAPPILRSEDGREEFGRSPTLAPSAAAVPLDVFARSDRSWSVFEAPSTPSSALPLPDPSGDPS